MDPLVTADDLATHLQRPVEPKPAALAVAGASGVVRAHCGWSISFEQAVTLHAAGSGTKVVGLPTLHLVAVDEVRVDGVVLAPQDFVWARRGQLYREASWPGPFGVVEVDCDHGYVLIPDVVRLVTLSVAAREYTNPVRLRTAAVGSVSRTYELTGLDTALLDPFRIFP